MTTIVNIGRNYKPDHETLGNMPLGSDHWLAFIESVESALLEQGGKDIHVFTGYSRYNGVGEDSASIQCFDDDDLDLYALKIMLRSLAWMYEQDSIALTTAPTEFVS